MNLEHPLPLWNPDDAEFPVDAREILQAVYFTILHRQPEWSREEFLRALLATPEIQGVGGLLDGIAGRLGLTEDDEGRLVALNSVLAAGEELRIKGRAISERLKACEDAGDVAGQTEALRALAHLEPCWVDQWLALAAHVEKVDSAAAALAELRAGERHVARKHDYRLEVLRLVCACGTREEALAEGQRLRKECGFFGELFELGIQSEEEYLLAWRNDPDAEERRRHAREAGDVPDQLDR